MKITRVLRVGLFVFVLVLLSSVAAHAGTINAASCSSSDVQAAINAASSGGTVVVPSGTCTWTSAVTISGQPLTITGQTVCTPSGTPGTSGYAISCVDGTIISAGIPGALAVSGSSASLVTVTGFTFKASMPSSNFGSNFGFTSTYGPPGYRLTGCHIIMPISSSSTYAIGLGASAGLVDHNWFQDTTTSAPGSPVMEIFGDFNTHGYYDWNQPTQLGANVGVFIEANYYTTSHQNTEGFFDCYSGGKVILRYNTLVGNGFGGNHGTDSGNYRSCVSLENYENYVSNSNVSGQVLSNTRGGTYLFWGNTVAGSQPWNGVSLTYDRALGNCIGVFSGWGCVNGASGGLNWVPISTTPSSVPTSDNMTLNASAYQTGHTYPALSVTTLSGSCSVQTVAGGTTGGSAPACPAAGSSVTDSGGVVWINVGGFTAASQASTAGWCAANPDTMAASDSVCSALQPGDTASRYTDANGGVYPFRDQPGVCHNQVVCPDYEWLNTGSNLPSSIMGPSSSATAGVVTQNRDYYLYTSNFTGATGMGSGTLAARPSACTPGPGGNTPGVAYWATDQGSWNQSGSGEQGELFVCTATNTWSLYYAPYTYPYPLNSSAMAPTPPSNLQATIQ